eukprot:TRINITY_DN38031_c0_g1_i1.p1 TRINITY_DN38031_c0_g1~~TRINITY_DN38031_c0_g1_i1.p1  ORF type:complete len:1727 (+),score=662.87 TRINITY_DN38031_c0_g1_i1:149-5329(+)
MVGIAAAPKDAAKELEELELRVQSLQKDVDSKASTIKHLQNALDAKSMTIGILSKANKEGGGVESHIKTAVQTKIDAAVAEKAGEIAKLTDRLKELEATSRGSDVEDAVHLAVEETKKKAAKELEEVQQTVGNLSKEKARLSRVLASEHQTLEEERARVRSLEKELEEVKELVTPAQEAWKERDAATEAYNLARNALEEAKTRATEAEQRAEEASKRADEASQAADQRVKDAVDEAFERAEAERASAAELRTQMRDYQTKAFELKSTNDVLTSQLEGLQEEMQSMQDDHQKELDEAQKKLRVLEADQNSQWRAVTDSIDSRVKEMREAAEKEKQTLLEEQLQEVAKERQRFRELTEEADKLRLRCDAQEVELTALRDALEDDTDGRASVRKSMVKASISGLEAAAKKAEEVAAASEKASTAAAAEGEDSREGKRAKAKALREQSQFAFDEMTKRLAEVREEVEGEKKKLSADFEQKLKERGAKIVELENRCDILQTQVETLEQARDSLQNQREELNSEIREKDRDLELGQAEVEGLTHGKEEVEGRLASFMLMATLQRGVVSPAFSLLRQRLEALGRSKHGRGKDVDRIAVERCAVDDTTDTFPDESTVDGDGADEDTFPDADEDDEDEEEEDDEEERSYGVDQEGQEDFAEMLKANTLSSLLTGAGAVVQNGKEASEDLQEHVGNILYSLDLFPHIHEAQLQVLDKVGKGKELRNFVLLMQRAVGRCQRMAVAILELLMRGEDFFAALQNIVRTKGLEWQLRGLRAAGQYEVLLGLQRNMIKKQKTDYEDVLESYGEQCESNSDLERKCGELEKQVDELKREKESGGNQAKEQELQKKIEELTKEVEEQKKKAALAAAVAAEALPAQAGDSSAKRGSLGDKSTDDILALAASIKRRDSELAAASGDAPAAPAAPVKGKAKGKGPPPPGAGKGGAAPATDEAAEAPAAPAATDTGAPAPPAKGKGKAKGPPLPGALAAAAAAEEAPAEAPPGKAAGKGPPPPGGKGPPPPGGKGPPPPGGKGPPPPGGKGPPLPGGKGPPMPEGKGPPLPGGKGPPMPAGKGPPMPGGKGPAMPAGKGPAMPGGKGPAGPVKGGPPGKGKGKGGKGGLPAIDPGPEPPKELMPKKFHWTGVQGNRFATSIFADIVADMSGEAPQDAEKPKLKRLKVDLFQLTRHFFTQKKAGPTPEELAKQAASAKKTVATCLDGKRSQNVEIFLNGAGVTVEQVRSCVLDLNEKAMHTDNLVKCIDLYPPSEEVGTLKEFEKNNDPKDWGRAERFLLSLMGIDNFMLRAECCVTRGTFDEEFKGASTDVALIKASLLGVVKSTALPAIFAMIMQIGNYLNFGTNKGAQRGFSLDTLPLMMRVEGFNDKNYSLMRFMMDSLEVDKRLRDEAFDNMSKCEEASKLDFDESCRQVGELEKKVAKVLSTVTPAEEAKDGEKAATGKVGDAQFESALRAFATAADKKVKELRTQVDEVTELCKQCIDMYAEKQKTPIGEVLVKFSSFRKDMEAARRHNLEAKLKREKAEKRRQEQKAKDAAKEAKEAAKAAKAAEGGGAAASAKAEAKASPKAGAAPAVPGITRKDVAAGAVAVREKEESAQHMRTMKLQIPDKPKAPRSSTGQSALKSPRGDLLSSSAGESKPLGRLTLGPAGRPGARPADGPTGRQTVGPGGRPGRQTVGPGGRPDVLKVSGSGRISVGVPRSSLAALPSGARVVSTDPAESKPPPAS